MEYITNTFYFNPLTSSQYKKERAINENEGRMI